MVYDNSVAYFSIVEEPLTGEATENVEETEGQDLWIASVEVAVIKSRRERFLSEWKRAIPSELDGVIIVSVILVLAYYVACFYHHINFCIAKLPFLYSCQMCAYRYNVEYIQSQT